MQEMPAEEDIQAIEITLFKNLRIMPYVISVYVWEWPEDKVKTRIPNWTCSARMWPEADAYSELVNTRKRAKRAVLSDRIEADLKVIFDHGYQYVGVMQKKQGQGTYYYDYGYLALRLTPDETSIEKIWLIAEAYMQEITYFVTTNPDNSRFGHPKSGVIIVGQSRISYTRLLDYWATEVFSSAPPQQPVTVPVITAQPDYITKARAHIVLSGDSDEQK